MLQDRSGSLRNWLLRFLHFFPLTSVYVVFLNWQKIKRWWWWRYFCTSQEFSGLLSHQVNSAEHPSVQGTDAIWQCEENTRLILFYLALAWPPAGLMPWPHQAVAAWDSCTNAGGEIRRGNILLGYLGCLFFMLTASKAQFSLAQHLDLMWGTKFMPSSLFK